ncbi:Hop1 protein [Maudiozyma humilis]|uniref:Hop1 protein n=1 Tax=Maudiozyma humilis TaxID=51915 RepID=A0AAV5RVB6_MAUHU|nr:Hop1 protein [Kazachstania humilis]
MLATKSRIKTAVTTEQSQKLMQTMLTMSFGCLSFLRGLFPDDSFVDQRFVPAKCESDYDKSKTNPSNSIKIKTLVRGKSQEVGLLLDWLEKGVFKSMKEGCLRSVSLGIYLDEDDPTNLCENYVFNFEYDENNEIRMNLDEMSTPPRDDMDTTSSLLDSRKMAQQVMRRFIIITQAMEPLPQKKYLSMRLLFNENVEQDYQPEMFRDATFDKRATLKIPIDSSSSIFRAGEVKTTHHSVNTDIYSTSEELRGCVDVTRNGLKEGIDFQVIDPFDLEPTSITSQSSDIEHDLDTQQTSQSVTDSKFSQNLCYSQSLAETQTTRILGKFLKSPRLELEETQLMQSSLLGGQKVEYGNDNFCDCLTECKQDATAQKICRKCNRSVHGICYGNVQSKKIPMCFVCILGSSSSRDIQSAEYKDLMVVRKCFRYLTRCKRFPSSLTDLSHRIFARNSLTEEVKERVAFACSIFLYDGTLVIDTGNNYGNLIGNSKTRGANFTFDLPTVKPPVGTVIIPTQNYNIHFLFANETSHPCYSESYPADKEQFSIWLKEISDLRLKLTENLPEKFTINSLDLNDSDLNELLKVTESNKRKYREESPCDGNVSEYPSQQIANEVSLKRQKISISEQSLKSVW